MKKTNKKGFTIVELVIVIAVIAILSAVLIPTFGTIISEANASAELQEARNAYTGYLSEVDNVTSLGTNDLFVKIGNNYYGETSEGEFGLIESYTAETGDVVIDADGNAVTN